MSQSIDHLPPQNTEAEEAVLGSLLLDPDAVGRVAAIIKPGDFYREKNGAIYHAISDLYFRPDSAGRVDFVTVSDALRRSGAYDAVGGMEYLSRLIGIVPTAVHVEHYARMVQRCAVKRRLILAAGKMAGLAYRDDSEPQEDVAACWKLLDGIKVGQDRYRVYTPEEQADEFRESVMDLALKGEVGLPTGYADLDYLIGGFEPGQLITLIAVTSLGKSAWALSLSRQVAVRVPVLFASVEMTRRQLEWRHAAALCQVSSKELRYKVAKGIDKAVTSAALNTAAEKMGQTKLHIWHQPQMTTLDIRATAMEWKQRHSIGLVVVDYLQILHAVGKPESRRVQVSQFCHELKAIAGEVDVPVVALCQVSREAVKQRDDKRPTLFDALETGSIEQDSDLVLGLYRHDFFYEPGKAIGKTGVTCEKGKAELLVLKQRDGATGTVPLTWKATTAEYTNYNPEPPL